MKVLGADVAGAPTTGLSHPPAVPGHRRRGAVRCPDRVRDPLAMPIQALVFDAYGTLYDVHSVARATEAAFPGHGDTITQIWRLKQLEYTWLRGLMARYEDFRAVTRDSLAYTLAALGLTADTAVTGRIVEAYHTLDPYPEAAAALEALAGYRLAILSNGSPDMLEALVRHSGLARHFEAVISVDAARTYKPDPRAYALVQVRLGLPPEQVLFVSSNGFDVCGAKACGFTVARVARVSEAALRAELGAAPPGPAALFRALRTQTEVLGQEADAVVGSLLDLPALAATLGAGISGSAG
jgi:2-haloacid dehalogenase